MSYPSVKDIKRAQKESLLLRHIVQWMRQEALEDEKLRDFTINRVKLTPDKGTCIVYFYTPKGKEYFDKMLEYLKQYKGPLRKGLAEAIPSRYVVNLMFKYDEAFEKQQKIEELIDRIAKEES